MARSRNLKPGFFHNEVLADCEPLARLLFASLWCIADREGRLEYRPRKIKVECLPYDNCDIASLVKELTDRGFVVSYNIKNIEYLQIVNFLKHQTPHVKEPASTIPEPDLSETVTSVAGAVSPSSLFPLPSSLNPLPDSLIPHPDSSKRPPSRKRAAGVAVLPPDWKPDLGYAEKLGLMNGTAVLEATKFMAYWTEGKGFGKRRSAKGWNQTWFNWVQRALENPQRGSNGHTKDGPATALMRAALGAVEDRQRQREIEGGGPAPIALLGGYRK